MDTLLVSTFNSFEIRPYLGAVLMLVNKRYFNAFLKPVSINHTEFLCRSTNAAA